MYIRHFCSNELYIRMWIFLLVQLVRIYVVILLGYVAGLRISCCIFAGPLVGTPDVMSFMDCKYIAGLIQAGCYLVRFWVYPKLPHWPGICVVVASIQNLCAMYAMFF